MVYIKYKVNPDICIFESFRQWFSNNNNYWQKNEIFEKYFHQQYFWSDRIGCIAALKTISIIEKENF